MSHVARKPLKPLELLFGLDLIPERNRRTDSKRRKSGKLVFCWRSSQIRVKMEEAETPLLASIPLP